MVIGFIAAILTGIVAIFSFVVHLWPVPMKGAVQCAGRRFGCLERCSSCSCWRQPPQPEGEDEEGDEEHKEVAQTARGEVVMTAPPNLPQFT